MASPAASRVGFLGAFDEAGTPLWTTTLSHSSTLREIEAVAVDAQGQIVSGGFVGGDGTRASIVGHDAQGEAQWELVLDELPDAIIRDLVFDREGRLWAVGETESAAGDDDGFIAVLDLLP